MTLQDAPYPPSQMLQEMGTKEAVFGFGLKCFHIITTRGQIYFVFQCLLYTEIYFSFCWVEEKELFSFQFHFLLILHLVLAVR